MKNYKYDYDRTCFYIKRISTDEIKYYMRVNTDFIEVSEQVFKICKRSYDKIRKDERRKVDRSIFNYEDIDQSTFFVVNHSIEKDIVNQIYMKDIVCKIKHEILFLPERDRKITICIFIKEYSDRETSRLLHIPQTTVTYRKKIIRENIKNNIKKFCSLNE